MRCGTRVPKPQLPPQLYAGSLVHTRHWRRFTLPGRQGEAPIREPGDLPSTESTRQTPVGVYWWMIRRTLVPLVLARADVPVTRGPIMLNLLRSTVDDASTNQRARVTALYLVLFTFTVLAWIWAAIALAGRPTLLGTAFLAYVLGLRHAVDADHIAAIDNVVRKLMQEGRRPLAAGFFFSLGHSLSIALAVTAIAATAFVVQGRFHDWQAIGSIISTGVSAFFLLAIAVINIVILRGIWSSFRRARRGEPIVEEELNLLLSGRGFLSRLFRPLFRMVSASWHMFPIGFLFGLGFDTATEITLFAVAASQASGGMTFATVMIFPALFTAGMTLVDTTDSVLMVGAYGWAFLNPMRKIWYNLTITAISVMVALLIGGIEALGLLAEQLHAEGLFWHAVDSLNDGLDDFGYVVLAIFVISWSASYLIYRWRIDRPAIERVRTAR